MLKGLAITPPVIGRISIGRIVEKNGKRLPGKDDQFTITTQIQTRDGWALHPYNETLRKDANTKLRSIPVRMLFNDPNLNLRANYSAFDKATGRPICVGNGETCRRATDAGMQTLPCPAPDGCEYGQDRCKPYGRLNVVIGDDDELGTFIFRTTSFNSIRTLTARLRYYAAVSGNLLSVLPLELKLRGKSTIQSHRSPVYYVDLVILTGLTLSEAMKSAYDRKEYLKAAGLDQSALDEIASVSLDNGAFEDTVEDAVSAESEAVDHFDASNETESVAYIQTSVQKPSVKDRLEVRA